MSLSLPHPHPMQEGLQASSLLTSLHLLSPYGPWLGDHAASFPWAQGAKNPRTLVASFWRGHPKGTRYWSSPALAPHTQQAQTPRVLGFCESRNPSWCTGKPRGKDRGVLAHHLATVGPPAHSQPHWDPTHVYILARATPPDPGQGVVQQQVWGN